MSDTTPKPKTADGPSIRGAYTGQRRGTTSHSPGPGFLAAGLAMLWVVWSGALTAGGPSEFKELGVPFTSHPGLTIQKVRLTMAVLASSSS